MHEIDSNLIIIIHKLYIIRRKYCWKWR